MVLKNLSNSRFLSSQSGIAAIAVLFILFIILGLLIGADYGYIALTGYCENVPTMECISGTKPNKPAEPAQKQTVIVATGNISGDKYNVTVTMNIPVEGGAVTGTFSGTCDGKISGTATKDGAISGEAFGSCSLVVVPVPARGEFDGTVIPQTKSVPIMGTGTAMGISKSGSITLTY